MSKKFLIKIPVDFVKINNLDIDNFVLDLKHYLDNFYTQNKSQFFSVQSIKYHKIDIPTKHHSRKKWARTITFFILNQPISDYDTVIPVFIFTTQEEKKYNSKLSTPCFAKDMENKLL